MGFLDDEGMLLGGLSVSLLLHRPHIWAYPQVVLDYPPWDPGQVFGFPSEYILVGSQEVDQCLLLILREASPYGEGGAETLKFNMALTLLPVCP